MKTIPNIFLLRFTLSYIDPEMQVYILQGAPYVWDKILKRYCGFIFGARHFSPSFLWWKNVYILIFGINKKNPPYDLAHLSNLDLAESLKNKPNHRRDPLIFKKTLFQKPKCTHFSTIKMRGKSA